MHYFINILTKTFLSLKLDTAEKNCYKILLNFRKNLIDFTPYISEGVKYSPKYGD